MLKWIVILVCGWFLYKMFTNDSRKKAEQKQETEKHKASTGEMVKDPVCGAYVSRDQQIRVRSGDTLHHFCSYECRDSFLQQLENTKQVPQKTSASDAADTEPASAASAKPEAAKSKTT